MPEFLIADNIVLDAAKQFYPCLPSSFISSCHFCIALSLALQSLAFKKVPQFWWFYSVA